MMIRILCLLLSTMNVISIPVDDPVRIDLPVYDDPQPPPKTILAVPLVPENHPGSRNIKIKNKAISNGLGNTIDTTPPIGSVNYGGGIFSAPPTKLEGALLETEGLGSKTLSVKENAENVLAGLFQPKPIVDTIQEEEKYGNTGEKFEGVGRAIVGGAEGFSNFVNSFIEVPSKILKSITRAASEKLNNLGGKLIGL